MRSKTLQGVSRSLRLYHANPAHAAALDRLYIRWISPGDIVFDIGAHAGDRVSSFRRLGARVVALEPQRPMMRALQLIHGRDSNVVLIAAAAGETAGYIDLHINTANPTVSTASAAFISEAKGAKGWEGQDWDGISRVPMVTLAALIAAYGMPSFVKIDVEGFEARVIAGLDQPLPALSFEFTTIARDVASRSIACLAELGAYRYNLARGESQTLEFETWLTGRDITEHLAALPHEANSGDVYAILANEQ